MEVYMLLKLTVYTDESMSEVKRVVETDELKIPYRVTMFLLSNLDKFDESNDKALLEFVAKNTDKVDKIIKATYGVSESELECINTMEIIDTVKALYQWTLQKVNAIGGKEKNLVTPAQSL